VRARLARASVHRGGGGLVGVEMLASAPERSKAYGGRRPHALAHYATAREARGVIASLGTTFAWNMRTCAARLAKERTVDLIEAARVKAAAAEAGGANEVKAAGDKVGRPKDTRHKPSTTKAGDAKAGDAKAADIETSGTKDVDTTASGTESADDSATDSN
jgi:hypothetical protein